eukprot:TRINITY_DN4539_c0_g1_i2.p1 TRINITY_DN4539_c0_g1~~TRINITY_DN4539_c0_g1_i2.p1  ORF type:complete len:167 (-),score=42.96 TRINITY_DN4539_c0_g1_i2:30-530(-)
MHNHFYRVFYMVDPKGVVVACALVVELAQTSSYHIDYFCVRPGMRGGGLGGRFFQRLVSYLEAESKFTMITLESELKMIPWYIKQGCLDWEVVSDTYGEQTWHLLMVPLGGGGASPPLSPRTSLVLSGPHDPPPMTDVLRFIVREVKALLAADLDLGTDHDDDDDM